jgi:CTP:molybdopterin cytidylyltransferase MocA
VATGLDRDPARAQLADDHLDTLIATAVLLGASPVVVAHDGSPRVAPPARGCRLPRAERDDLSAVRLGLMQFTNAPVGAALVLPIEAHAVSPDVLQGMMAEAARRGVPLAAVAAHGALGMPLYATRDVWRELMTTEGGLPAVLRTLGPRVLAIEVE